MRWCWVLSMWLGGSAAAQAQIAELPVRGFGAAAVSEAAPGAPRPVLVAAHGSFDRPDWHCQTWRQVFGDRLFVLCPRGTLRWDTPPEPQLMRYYYRSDAQLEKEMTAGLAALRARYGERVAPGPVLYLGFSQGAIYGTPLLVRRAALLRRAVLVEGGAAGWSAASARRYRRAGGERVLFACGQPACVRRAEAALPHLTRAGVPAKVVFGAVGHHYQGALAEQIQAAAAWLLEGDARLPP